MRPGEGNSRCELETLISSLSGVSRYSWSAHSHPSPWSLTCSSQMMLWINQIYSPCQRGKPSLFTYRLGSREGVENLTSTSVSEASSYFPFRKILQEGNNPFCWASVLNASKAHRMWSLEVGIRTWNAETPSVTFTENNGPGCQLLRRGTGSSLKHVAHVDANMYIIDFMYPISLCLWFIIYTLYLTT